MKVKDEMGFAKQPYYVEKLLSDGKYGQILSLLQKTLLFGKITAGLALFLHVICKLLLRSAKAKVTRDQTTVTSSQELRQHF